MQLYYHKVYLKTADKYKGCANVSKMCLSNASLNLPLLLTILLDLNIFQVRVKFAL